MTDRPESHQFEKLIVHADADIQDLIPGYLTSRKKNVGDIRTALEQGDYDTVRTLGHNMKGSGGGYGFEGISEIGASMEESAKAGDAEAIQRLVVKLSDYLNRVEVIYE